MNIKWSELTTEERDRLVHEKVLQLPLYCKGTIYYQTGFKVNGEPYRKCRECGQYPIYANDDGHYPIDHIRLIPSYSTDMNAAWQIVVEMNKPQDGGYDRYGRFIEELERLIGSNLLFDALNTEKGNASYAISMDSIAIAALKAVGVEIEL